MKILVITSHFPPDLSAGAFRISSLVQQLRSKISDCDHVDVYTIEPHRYKTYKAQKNTVSNVSDDNISILYYEGNKFTSKYFGEIALFASFAFWTYWRVRKNKYDLVFCTSSKLMAATLGAFIARKQNTKLYLDIRDLFLDTLISLYPWWWVKPFLFPIRALENYTYCSASTINIVSGGFANYIRQRAPNVRVLEFTNGIDDDFISYFYSRKFQSYDNKNRDSVFKKKKLRVLYAGNIGKGQGLHNIIPQLASKLKDNFEFLIIGGGRCVSELEKKVKDYGCNNVNLMAPIERKSLIDYYNDADILFLHLNVHKAFEKVLPSKIFEYAATGKPIIAGVDGYAKKFIHDNIENAETFEPANVAMALDILTRLDLSLNYREQFISKFKRDSISSQMSDEIISLAKE